MERGAEVEVVCGAGDDLQFGLAWEFTKGVPPVDLDAQAVMFDSMGALVDAAFYNQLEACGGAVKHMGDNKDGSEKGYDEIIKFDLNSMPENIAFIVLLVSVHTEGQTFNAVESAAVDLKEMVSGRNLCSISVGCAGKHTSLCLCSLNRKRQADGKSKWFLKNISKTMEGRNFSECKEAIHKDVIDVQLDPNLVSERVLSMDKTFDMKKDDVAVVPDDLKDVFLGLGWTCKRNLDLDSSVILLSRNLKVQSIVSFSNLLAPGVRHRGDNTTGVGDGDDEVIFVDLKNVQSHVHHLVFVVNVYTDGGSFSEISQSYVRLVSGSHNLARYQLDGNIHSRGLAFCRLSRKQDKWVLHCIGQGCGGKKAADHDCKNDVINLLKTFHPEDDKLGDEAPAAAERSSQLQSEQAAPSECCIVL
eukprot:TRINITY_DN2322_c0_g1_i1.p1 TRINITY_DN2322_c0_g1~~TRINITY_DN2322_c0_g1_i1.p1  ORF type:complete len:416 (-),score=144.44 TRINITY_DN2322_c0_g1_i1:41-1288(-)